MTKQEWSELYGKLEKVYSEFLLEYPQFENGRNAQIRSNAERKVLSLISSADNLISKRQEAFELLTGEDNTEFGSSIAYEEFLIPRYFYRDMGEFLEKIRVKIKNSESE